MIFFRKQKQSISIVILVASLLLMYNNIMNQHKHLIQTGVYVVHAHPFSDNSNGDNTQKHHHNSIEYILISTLNTLFTIFVVIGIINILPIIKKIKSNYRLLSIYDADFKDQYYNLRAPPIFI